jgi:hypothetical protein
MKESPTMILLLKSRLALGALGAGGAALALVLSLGHVSAQSAPTATATPKGATATANRQSALDGFLANVAGKLNVSVDQLKSAISGAEKDGVNARVSSGQLTQAQADKLIQRIDQGGPALLPRILAARRAVPAIAEHVVAVVATQTGLTPQQVRDQVRGGKSLAQIGQEHGKTVPQLEAAITADFKTRLDQAVAKGTITADQESNLLSRATSGLDKVLNHQPKPKAP